LPLAALGDLAFNSVQAVAEQPNQIIRQDSVSAVLICMNANKAGTWE
jgi:hypothetical protein